MYAAVENLGLNTDQRAVLEAALRAMGCQNDPRPINNNHWRRRTDGNAALYHGDFQESEWNIAALKAKLGAIFGVDPTNIGDATQAVSYSPGGTSLAITFSRGATSYLRLLLLGGRGATQAQGEVETLGYLRANAVAWGEE